MLSLGPAQIHGTISEDFDGDGQRDLGVEPGLAGVTVFLDYDNDGTLGAGEPSMETLQDDPATPGVDETGTYYFEDLLPGTYTVAQIVQDGWVQTYPTPPMELYALGSGVGDYRSDFYRIDDYAANPTAHYIGQSYIYNGPLADMAYDPTTGKIHAVAWATNKLYEIDRGDGHAIWYGSRGAPGGETAVAFDSRGQLYSWGCNGDLFLIDKVTGEKTSLGEVGYTASHDLAFDLDGTLYGLAHDESGSGSYLLRIDPLTAESTVLSSYGFPEGGSLEIGPDGAMYLARNVSDELDLVELYRVDKSTWEPTLIGAIPGTGEWGLHGMAFLPSRSPGGTHLVTLGNDEVRTGVDFGNRAILDFGDAADDPALPGDYPTLAESDGARHVLSNRLFFGMGVDAEMDGQPGADGLGDDLHLAADEEGVRFTSELVPGTVATLEISASGDGLLSAWIDFNGDGDWDDPDEQVYADEPISQGVNSRSFLVPPSAQPAEGTFARFRLSTQAGLSYSGMAPDGEVEDYRVALSLPAIDVGDHVLLPDTPDQMISIPVTGGTSVQGVVFNVQVADGYPEVPDSSIDGPNIARLPDVTPPTPPTMAVDLTDEIGTGTVFGSVPNSGNYILDNAAYEQIWIVGAVTDSGAVAAEGTLALVWIDTRGWESGTWDLKLADTFSEDTNFNGPVGQIYPDITNGTIRVDQRPVAVIADPGGVPEEGSVALDASGSFDPDTPLYGDTIVSYEWDLDDDGLFGETGTAAERGNEQLVNPTFSAAGLDGPSTWTVRLKVTDNHAAESFEVERVLSIDNVAPTIALSGASSVDEGSAYSLTLGAITDPGDDTVTQWVVHWGDGDSDTYASAGVKTHTYSDDDPTSTPSDPYQIRVDLVDEDGTRAGAGTKNITVANVEPVITSLSTAPAVVRRNEPVDLVIEFSDPGTPDVHRVSVTWGDGETSGPLAVTPTGSRSVTVSKPNPYSAGGDYTATVTLEDDDAGSDTDSLTVAVRAAEVVDRHVFYNASVWDWDASGDANGNGRFDPGEDGSLDDNAVAPDKTALLPGETATFQNYTSYTKGINGIMVDIAGLPGTPTVNDFEFRTGNDDEPGGWGDAPAPADRDGDGVPDITVRPGAGAGGSDRVTIVWPSYDAANPDPTTQAVAKQWLQVNVLATENTGLPEPDVFYFGNAIGETGDSTTFFWVNATDEVRTRANQGFNRPLEDPYDFNRDKFVNATDQVIARFNQVVGPNSLYKLTAPATAPLSASQAAAPAPASGDMGVRQAAFAEYGSMQSTTPGGAIEAATGPAGLSWLDTSDPPGTGGRSTKTADRAQAAVEKLLATL